MPQYNTIRSEIREVVLNMVEEELKNLVLQIYRSHTTDQHILSIVYRGEAIASFIIAFRHDLNCYIDIFWEERNIAITNDRRFRALIN